MAGERAEKGERLAKYRQEIQQVRRSPSLPMHLFQGRCCSVKAFQRAYPL